MARSVMLALSMNCRTRFIRATGKQRPSGKLFRSSSPGACPPRMEVVNDPLETMGQTRLGVLDSRRLNHGLLAWTTVCDPPRLIGRFFRPTPCPGRADWRASRGALGDG